MFTVTPQILIPLSADLAPPHRRASAMSIVLSGLLLGLLLARVLAGIIAEFSSWRNVYYMAIGLQYFIVALLWLTIPDYEAKGAGTGLTYWEILWTMGKYLLTEPILVQSCLISAVASATFSSFWVSSFVLYRL
jgi:predicted MFS family arabinose efflux permease